MTDSSASADWGAALPQEEEDEEDSWPSAESSEPEDFLTALKEKEIENLENFLEENDASHLLDFLQEHGVTCVADIVHKITVGDLETQGVAESDADALLDAAEEEVRDVSDSGSENEVFTEEERAPPGAHVHQLVFPDHIKEHYTFLELLHDAGHGHCAFLCEKSAKNGEAEADKKRTAPGKAKSRGSILKDSEGVEQLEEEGSARQAKGPRQAYVGDSMETAIADAVDAKGKLKTKVVDTKKLEQLAEAKRTRCVIKLWRKGARSYKEEKVWLETHLFMMTLDRHPNVSLPRRLLEDKRAYYVEFDVVLVGCSLMTMILNDASTTEKQVKRIIRGVLRGLSFLHHNGLVHRDIKPDNVLLEWVDCEQHLLRHARPPVGWGSSKHGIRRWRPAAQFKNAWKRHDVKLYVRIIDLDTVVSIKRGEEGKALPERCGTPGFMAPEAYTGFGGAQADLWGVGMLLYLLVRVDAPFHDISFKAMRGAELSDEIPKEALQRVYDAVVGKLAEIDWDGEPWNLLPTCRDLCRLLLHKNPKIRGADAADVLETSPWFQKSDTGMGNAALDHLKPKGDNIDLDKILADEAESEEEEEEKGALTARSGGSPRAKKDKEEEKQELPRGAGGGRRGNIVLPTLPQSP